MRLFAQLPRTRASTRRHLDALRAIAGDHERIEVFEHLYGDLSILDDKSSSLLGFNSIIIAVFAIFLATDLPTNQFLVATVGMALVLVSSTLLLWVVWIHWSTTDDLLDAEAHGLHLLEVRGRRTIRYRLAWYFAVAGLVALATLQLLQVVSRFSR